MAKNLEKHRGLSTILIDKKSYFEYTPKIHRLPLEASFVKKKRRSYVKILRNTEIITDKIRKVTPKTVETEQNKVSFDFLVIATGIEYPIRLDKTTAIFPLKSSEDAIQIGLKLPDAERIIIIGGGLIGTEVAAELATKTKNKHIILVHSKERLLERLPIRAANYAEKFLRRQGVSIFLGERIVEHHGNQFVGSSGHIFNADLGIWSAGIEWNPTFMQEFPSTVFSSQSALRVNPFLQLSGYSNIFVGGDITNISEEKTAQHAERHAKIIYRNILRKINEKPLVPYLIQSRPLTVTLGDWNGIISYKNLVVVGLLPALGKALVDWWTFRRYS